MINQISSYLLILIFIMILIIPDHNNAKEILVYADDISYDTKKNIIARGNAKVIYEDQFILSDLIIYDKINDKIVLPSTFTFKDSTNNFFQASSGYFEKNLKIGEFEDIKIRLNDGSRLIGDRGRREGDIDIISKAVYTPCKSRIKIADFICPTWQLEGEKIIHDNKNLFLYQKHSKMRVIHTPVFYIPYMVTPSPLRKERKSGFLSPGISFNFFDTKTSQSTSFPYYFYLDKDKELTFTPFLNYGGGVDSSQRFVFDYNQILSGGMFSSDFTFDSNFEKDNSDRWFKDASLITKYKKNINKNFRVTANSALQTKENYIQITKPDDELSYTHSLTTNLSFEGYNLRKIDDYLNLKFSLYQTNQKNEDSKTVPIVFPNFKYYSGEKIGATFSSQNLFETYNIIREKNTDIHSKNQQKLSHRYSAYKDFISLNSKFLIRSEIYNQIYHTENKKIDSNFHTGTYFRAFPIFSIESETPFKTNNNKYNFTYKPNMQLVVSPGISNTNKISNEDSSNNNFSLDNMKSLNRFSGSDKLDNSKRINYGIDIYNSYLSLKLSQNYEFTDNSNYHIEQGNDDNLSDLLGQVNYTNRNKINYNFRYDFNNSYLKQQNINIETPTSVGELSLDYLDQKSKIDNIITSDTETLNYSFYSKKFLNFSKIKFNGLYDLKKEINTEYSIGYSYYDECFGINIDFKRKSYAEENLKPQDVLTLMFSFKNIGSYKSTNIAVSENDKRDIDWQEMDIKNELFENIN